MVVSRRCIREVVLAALICNPIALHAASKNWTGGVGDWDMPGAWSPFGVPGNGDDVTIGQNGAVVTYIQPAAVSLNTLAIAGMGSGSSLLQSQDALSVNNLTLGSAVALGTYNFSGGSLAANNLTIKPAGTLTGSANVTNIPFIFFEGGSMTGSGETQVAQFHELHLLSADIKHISRTIRNAGTTYWTGGGVTGSGTFINNDTGQFIMTNDGAGPGLAFGIASFENHGTVTKQSGTPSTFGGAVLFDNQGLVQAIGGTRLEFNGPIVQRSGTTLTGGQWIAEGEIRFNSGDSTITHIGADAIVQLQGAASIFTHIDALTHNAGTFTISIGRNFTTAGGRGFTTAGALANSGELTIGPDSILTLAGTLHDTGVLNIDATGNIDLANQKMVTTGAPGAWDGSTYSGVTGLIVNGRIMTTSDFAGLTTIGVASADDTNYVGGNFGGAAVISGDVLLAYTLAGDANLDLLIDADDYFAIDSNYNKPASAVGYAKGDFNYDGRIDGDDYVAIDASFSGQGGFVPSLPVGYLTAASAVPEPGALAWLALITAAATARRRLERAQAND